MSWHKLPDLQFAANNIALTEVDGKKICIGRFEDKLYAFEHECPHAGAPMHFGEIDGKCNVVCPQHGYTFNLKTGDNVTGEGFHLQHWPVEKRKDGWYVGFEVKKSFWSFLRK